MFGVKNDNYIKTMKNILTVISSVTFFVNTIQTPSIDSFITFGFTYIFSIALTFYSLAPETSSAKKRRSILIRAAFWSIGIIFIGRQLSLLGMLVSTIVLYSIKGMYTLFAVMAICFTFIDTTAVVTAEEEVVAKSTRRNLANEEKARPYQGKKKRVEENEKTKGFILKHQDKAKKEETKR